MEGLHITARLGGGGRAIAKIGLVVHHYNTSLWHEHFIMAHNPIPNAATS